MLQVNDKAASLFFSDGHQMIWFCVSIFLVESSPKPARRTPTDPVRGAPRDGERAKHTLFPGIWLWSARPRLRFEIKLINAAVLLNLSFSLSPSAKCASWIAGSGTFWGRPVTRLVTCLCFAVRGPPCEPQLCHLLGLLPGASSLA